VTMVQVQGCNCKRGRAHQTSVRSYKRITRKNRDSKNQKTVEFSLVKDVIMPILRFFHRVVASILVFRELTVLQVFLYSIVPPCRAGGQKYIV
jgi:hypothetical protein